ncbi:hypothetical protein [Actinacidiphila acidipaludis]|uniref:Uncharacterized protein n=1 Tax=Actinacidiphila acidipaludis TaxID=2873382 RepID=A0ABS7QHB5_9ACTN|nr:hypothetical protein [Streptomyces acidipaludis]MBY8882550.1 hypothetical protein [Streptomyces acidipaludis]
MALLSRTVVSPGRPFGGGELIGSTTAPDASVITVATTAPARVPADVVDEPGNTGAAEMAVEQV